MLYNNLKKIVKKFPFLWKFLRWFKDYFILPLSREKDTLMMMILFLVWPEQTYRFSTRKLLPSKKNRLSKESRQTIPYDLLKSKSSNIPMMKEINLVGMATNLDFNNIKNFVKPTFLIAAWGPLRLDKNGKIFYVHQVSGKEGKKKTIEELFKDEKNNIYKNNNVTYGQSRKSYVEQFKKIGNKVLSVNTYITNKDKNYCPLSEEYTSPSYINLFDNEGCVLIALEQKIYKPPLLDSHPQGAPTSSFLAFICALSFFSEKINVYGWDFYLTSTPKNMSYLQLILTLYKMKNYDNPSRGRVHFETALINFYYGYQLSKLPNFKIHGYMGQLGKHHRLIKRIERVLFNK
tara:strand:+ start:5339 stop:6379 length:1041 start_codon:yes stop_codon:yes gene_type:complete